MRILFAILTAISGYAAAQPSVRILSRTEGLPVTGARVIWGAAGAAPQGSFTDSTGRAIAPAPLILPCTTAISAIGYAPVQAVFTGTDTTLLLMPLTVDAVVITGQYAQHTANQAVHRIRVIDQQRMQDMGAISVADVLTKELNIRISRDAVLGSAMTMQGISGENVKILVDGVPVIGRQNGNVDLSQLNIGDIERIEVVEGPLSVNYGTNALAGTINLITKKERGKKPSASLMGYAQSVGQYNTLLTAGGNAGKWKLNGSAGRNLFDGWNPGDAPFPDGKRPVADASRYKSWKPKWQQFGRWQIQRPLSKSLTLSYKGEAFGETVLNRGLPRAPYQETAFDDTYRTRRLDHAMNLQGALAPALHLNVIAAYNTFQRIKNTWLRDLTTLEQTLTSTSGDQDTSRMALLNVRATLAHSRPNQWLAWEAGTDLVQEWMDGRRIAGAQQHIGDYAAFATAEISPSLHGKRPLVLRPGVRLAYNTAYQAPLLPSLNLRWQLAPSLTWRMAYARGFRAPSIKELYFTFVDSNHDITGNPDLQAESSQHLSGGLTWQHTPEAIPTALRASVTGFYNDIHNLITLAQLDPNGTTYTYANVGRIITTGVNAEFSASQAHWRATLGGAYSARADASAEGTLGRSFSPELNAALTWDIARTHLRVSAFWKYNGRLPGFVLDESGNLTQTFINPYHTADLTVTSKLLKGRGLLTGGAKNLFNVQSVGAVSSGGAHSGSGAGSVSVGTGRTFFLSLTLYTTPQTP